MLQIVGTFILSRRNEMSKTDELELEIYQQIKSLEPRQQRIIYDNIKQIKSNMIRYGKLIASGKSDFKGRW